MVIKTIVAINDVLTHNYKSCFPNHVKGSACFEILGFDVMFDRKLKPYVVEVSAVISFNQSCSPNTRPRIIATQACDKFNLPARFTACSANSLNANL